MRVLLTIPLRAYKVALITVKVTAYIRAQKIRQMLFALSLCTFMCVKINSDVYRMW